MIRILYEDKYLVVCEKPVGVLSAPEPGKRRDMPALLRQQTRAWQIDIIHRLDQPVGGVMVYSKSRRATTGLYRQMAEHRITKEYLAVVCGVPPQPSGEYRDWLLKDAARCKSRVVPCGTPGAKEAVLDYRVLATVQEGGLPLTLVRVRLHTGRTHQIRVQFASRRMPLLGDEKYGAPARENFRGLGLWACRLFFRHPVTRQPVDAVCPPPAGYPWSRFGPVLAAEGLSVPDGTAKPVKPQPPKNPRRP